LRASSALRFFSTSRSSSTFTSLFLPLGFASLAFGSLGVISLGVSVASDLIPKSIGVAATSVSAVATLTSIICVITSCFFLQLVVHYLLLPLLFQFLV